MGDDFFPVKHVLISNTIDFDQSGLELVFVHLRYDQANPQGEPPRIVRELDGVLKSAADTFRFDFELAYDAAGKRIEIYQYRTEAYPRGSSAKVSSDWKSTTANELVIDSAALNLPQR